VAADTSIWHRKVDKGTCSYAVLWNAFKRLAAGYSADERTALFSGAAKKAYRLEV
jgi:L-fuconolactonase